MGTTEGGGGGKTSEAGIQRIGGGRSLVRFVKVSESHRAETTSRGSRSVKVEVLHATRPPFLRLITRQTETDEAERQRRPGETAVEIERDYTDRQRENKEQDVQHETEGEQDQGLNPAQL